MNGATPAVDDKGFVRNGKKYYWGAFGSDGTADIALVAERVAGQGVYTGAGASNTWEFVYRLDAALWQFQNPNADITMLVQHFVNQANAAYVQYSGDTSGVPVMPTELVAALQWFCKYKIQFRADTNQIVLV